MKSHQIAAQLYTCRDILKTPSDISKTLHRLREVGYTAVQVSGMGPIAEEELVKILEDEGLICCATHEPSVQILDAPQVVIERLKKLNCSFTAYPHPKDVNFEDLDAINAWIQRLDASAVALAQAGLTLCYHNHHTEFRKVGGKTILSRIYDEAPHIQGEPDTYWVQYGGGDNVAWCERLQGRLPLIHLKDYRITEKNEPTYCEIGAGNLDFSKIIPAAEKAGCQWFIIEQDECPGDPVDSLAQSFRYLVKNHCK